MQRGSDTICIASAKECNKCRCIFISVQFSDVIQILIYKFNLQLSNNRFIYFSFESAGLDLLHNHDSNNK